jgi:hypothetical protein
MSCYAFQFLLHKCTCDFSFSFKPVSIGHTVLERLAIIILCQVEQICVSLFYLGFEASENELGNKLWLRETIQDCPYGM